MHVKNVVHSTHAKSFHFYKDFAISKVLNCFLPLLHILRQTAAFRVWGSPSISLLYSSRFANYLSQRVWLVPSISRTFFVNVSYSSLMFRWMIFRIAWNWNPSIHQQRQDFVVVVVINILYVHKSKVFSWAYCALLDSQLCYLCILFTFGELCVSAVHPCLILLGACSGKAKLRQGISLNTHRHTI